MAHLRFISFTNRHMSLLGNTHAHMSTQYFTKSAVVP